MGRRASTLTSYWITALVLSAMACGIEPMRSSICTDEARPSITVVVLDSITGEGRAAGASVVLQEGAYRDSTARPVQAQAPADSIYWGTNTHERTGTYTVRVRRAGYAVWERENVQVTGDICHVQTLRVRARLQASP